MKIDIKSLSRETPVLLAGPTASGKSALAMEIAAAQNRTVINADALQVFADWRILTARPSETDEATVPHALYGHVDGSRAYSVGQWLRDVVPLLSQPCVIVGGTGLYFTALTEGLAEIPNTPDHIRQDATERLAKGGVAALLPQLDAETVARIDTENPRRVQRAWEVLTATGQGLAAWQDATGPAPLPLLNTYAFLLDAPKDWLTPRIEQRFDRMLDLGVLDEAHRNAPTWAPSLPSAKAIGAAELVAHVEDRITLTAAREAIVIATRQYAKRQRTWFRRRMQDWHVLTP